jgi:ABC-2 type transport system permease protein
MSMSIRPFLALVKKDLRVFLSDRRAVILSFAAPLMLASIFAMIGGGAGDVGASKIPVLVVDLDQSALSKEVVEGLARDANLEVESSVSTVAARERVRGGSVGLAVVIPSGFGGAAVKGLFRAGEKPELTFLTDPTHAAEAGMVRGILMQHAMQAISREAFTGQGGREALDAAESRLDQAEGVPFGLRQALRTMFHDIVKVREQSAAEKADARELGSGREGFGFDTPFTVKGETVKAGGQRDRGVMAAHAFAGMAVQFILFASVEAGIGLLTERQKGLWRRLRAAPLSRWALLGSKATSQALIALAILAVLFGFGAAVFHVRILGSWLGFALVSLAYALTASTFGLLIAALGKTPQAARGVSVMAVLLMVLLGGAWMPMFMFPGWVQSLTLAVPTRWAVDGLEGATWRGLGLIELLPRAAALLGFAAVFGCLAAARFRWEED